jgi:hypothetical protein
LAIDAKSGGEVNKAEPARRFVAWVCALVAPGRVGVGEATIIPQWYHTVLETSTVSSVTVQGLLPVDNARLCAASLVVDSHRGTVVSELQSRFERVQYLDAR